MFDSLLFSCHELGSYERHLNTFHKPSNYTAVALFSNYTVITHYEGQQKQLLAWWMCPVSKITLNVCKYFVALSLSKISYGIFGTSNKIGVKRALSENFNDFLWLRSVFFIFDIHSSSQTVHIAFWSAKSIAYLPAINYGFVCNGFLDAIWVSVDCNFLKQFTV